MASAKEVFLASLLGGIQGATSGYTGEQKNQRDYALKKLEIQKPPSDIESLKYVEPGFDDLDETAKRERLHQFKAASAGVDVSITPSGDVNKRPISGPQPTTTQEYKTAKNRVTTAEAAGRTPSPTDVGIVTKYEQGTKKDGGGSW